MLIDESGFLLQPLLRRTWAPRGQTPVIRSWDRHDRLTAITALALTPARRRCNLFFQLLDHNAKSEDFFSFIIMLHREIPHPLTIVWDRLSAHRKAARWFFELGCRWLRFVYLPPYCPELNPVEQVWSSTKWGRLANWPAPNIDAVSDRVSDDLQWQATQQRVLRGHFDAAGLNLK